MIDIYIYIDRVCRFVERPFPKLFDKSGVHLRLVSVFGGHVPKPSVGGVRPRYCSRTRQKWNHVLCVFPVHLREEAGHDNRGKPTAVAADQIC